LSSSSKCVQNRNIKMNLHTNLTFELILRKKNWAHQDSNLPKKFRFISGEPDIQST
jgi:hypothetical protein